MSETVREKGKIRLIEKIGNENIEEQIVRLYSTDKKWEDDYIKYPKEFIWNEKYNEVIISKNDLYEILEYKNLDTDYNFYEGSRNEDGTIDFHVMYYNGGCSLSEAIEEVLKTIDKK